MRRRWLFFLMFFLFICFSCDKAPLLEHTLLMEVEGQGFVSPLEGSHLYREGLVVDVEAIPNDGWFFLEWVGDVAQRESPRTTVVMDRDKSIKVIFVPVEPKIEEVIAENGRIHVFFKESLLEKPLLHLFKGSYRAFSLQEEEVGIIEEGEILFIDVSWDGEKRAELTFEPFAKRYEEIQYLLQVSFCAKEPIEANEPFIVPATYPYLISIDGEYSIEVPYGATEGEALLSLPETTAIVDSANREHRVELVWSIEEYDPFKAGFYKARGDFSLPEGVAQPDPPLDLYVTATVLVLEERFVEILSFAPPEGLFFPGDWVTSTIEFKNISAEKQEIYIGCSFQDKAGQWYDIPALRATLGVGEKSSVERAWIVPEDRAITSGFYDTAMAIWSAKPHEEGAEELARAEAKDTFSVYNALETFSSFDSRRWAKDNFTLGYSRLQPRNVQVEDSLLQIMIPGGTLNGGGISTRRLYSYGSYHISMQIPNAPSSITGFFLYQAPDFYHEIDIEIYNDSRGEAFFTTYANGGRTNTITCSLGFDPTKGFHTYGFDYYPQGITFYVNGEEIVSWSEGLTDEPMFLMINTWFPTWLEGALLEETVMTLVDWVMY